MATNTVTVKKRKRFVSEEAIAGWLFLTPATIMWLLWFLYPAIKAVSLSFYNYNYATPKANSFVGLTNFIRLFQDPKFYMALTHSFFMVAVVVPSQSLIAFCIALLLNGKIRGKAFFRTSFYLPYVISPVAVTIFFMYFFLKNGFGAKFFELFGFANVTWFTNVHYALQFVMIVYIWQQIGFYMVIFIGGLQGIPVELYEAAKVDGANAWDRVMRITIPLMKPTTYLVLILGMIDAFQIFDQIAALSKQSPLGSPAGATSTLVTFLYQQSFSYMNMGYGSAAAVVLFFIIFVMSAFREIVSKKED